MLRVGSVRSRNCQGITRRELLQVGGVSALGWTLADSLRAGAEVGRSRDRACIFLFLEGGPSQFETFDPKPNAPDDVRGPYGPISTSVAGVHFCELLPMLARRMDRCALIRSLTGTSGNHTAVPILTGSMTNKVTCGAVVTKLKGRAGDLPPYVHVGGKLFNSPGVGGNTLGAAYDPVEIPNPLATAANLPQFTLNAEVPAARFLQRTALLSAVDKARADLALSRSVDKMDLFYHRAADLLTSPKVRDAFDLSKEKPSVRERYGANFFGQSALMARRLVEAGTGFVQVKWYDWDGAWDIHGFNSTGIERMEQELCPRLDQGLSALLDDLRERGLFDSTLVVAVGEMGRTPKVNYWGGRDHWGPCLPVLLAGAGIPGGAVVGRSDANGAYPATDPVQPAELAATLYRRLGIVTNIDVRVRPFIGGAAPVPALV
jgi:hypothetical protein